MNSPEGYFLFSGLSDTMKKNISFFVLIFIWLIAQMICVIDPSPMNLELMIHCDHEEQMLLNGGGYAFFQAYHNETARDAIAPIHSFSWPGIPGERIYFYRVKPVLGILSKKEYIPDGKGIYVKLSDIDEDEDEESNALPRWLHIICTKLPQHGYFCFFLLFQAAVMAFVLLNIKKIIIKRMNILSIFCIEILLCIVIMELPSFSSLREQLTPKNEVMKSVNWNEPETIEKTLNSMKNGKSVFHGEKTFFNDEFYLIDLGMAKYCYFFPDGVDGIHHPNFYPTNGNHDNNFTIRYPQYVMVIIFLLIMKTCFCGIAVFIAIIAIMMTFESTPSVPNIHPEPQ